MTVPETIAAFFDYMLRRDAELRRRFVERFGCLPEDMLDGEPMVHVEWKH